MPSPGSLIASPDDGTEVTEKNSVVAYVVLFLVLFIGFFRY